MQLVQTIWVAQAAVNKVMVISREEVQIEIVIDKPHLEQVADEHKYLGVVAVVGNRKCKTELKV